MATNDPDDIADLAPCSGRRKASLAQCEVVRFREAFDAVDVDKDGLVTEEQAADAAHKAGYRLTAAQLQTLWKDHEAAGISFKQFLEGITDPTKDVISEDEHRLAELREKFERYDIDGDGRISLLEAQWTLHAELDVTPNTALRLLAEFVHLDYQQFAQFYTQVKKKKLEIYDMFGKYDVDRDGLISLDEAHNVLHKELGFTYHKSKDMVTIFDSNKDGMVSYIEFAEFYLAVEEKKRRIRQSFRHLDKEGKGYIGVSEACGVLQKMLGFSVEKSENKIKELDKNHDDKLDYEEFVALYATVEDERHRLLEEFSRYDQDQDGRISEQEFLVMMSRRGHSQQDARDDMKGYDLDHDGYLSFDEFKRFLNSC